MSSKQSNLSLDNFPTDLITIILSHLLVKSLLVCRAVCKTWRQIIDNPNFHQLHLLTSTTKSGNTSSSSSSYILLLSSDEIYIATEQQQEEEHEDNDDGKRVILRRIHATTKLDLLVCDKGKNCSIFLLHPPINGLMFYSHSMYYPTKYQNDFCMYICNPAIREYVKLPNIVFPNGGKSNLMNGFGFDIINNKFKVVVIFVCLNGRWEPKSQVYTLGSNSWRTLQSKIPKIKSFKAGSAFVNGSLHWLTRVESEDGLRSTMILSFNLASEDFGVISTSGFNFLSRESYLKAKNTINLVELGGCLSLVDSSSSHHINIWILKDYSVKTSWTGFSISKFSLDGIGRFEKVYVISFRKNGEIILLCDDSKLVSYNTETRNVMALEVDGLGNTLEDGPKCFGSTLPYVESLISPKSASDL
ncbi:hypothetical protein AQUCO_04700031v1 [Aquilegia coerulea]|uniref:F-box domain-containing protein n=1 Tax=Aquilegia coerulea TaxID=218851 RepID=A0A2G5CL35_AQUCA|nr:hypothetical protein AQUCO_04700031v1 [Aquilegia coerulea]